MAYDLQQALGDHDVTVESTEIIESGADLTIKVRVRFKDGEVGNKDLYPIKSEKSAQVTRKSLSAMGFAMDDRDLGELQRNPALLKGNTCRAVVEENEYNGNVTNRIAWINAIPKVPGNDMLSRATAKLRNVKKDNRNEEL